MKGIIIAEESKTTLPFLQFQEAMTNTLKMKTCSGVEKWTRRGGGGGGRDLESIVPPWPLQVTLTVRHVFWTAEVHQAICGGTQALRECLTRVEVRLRISCEDALFTFTFTLFFLSFNSYLRALSLIFRLLWCKYRNGHFAIACRQTKYLLNFPLGLIPSDHHLSSNPQSPLPQGEVHTIVAALRKTHLDSGRQSSRTPAASPPSSAASDASPRTPPSSGRVGAGSRLTPSPSRHALSVLILSAVYARDVLKELIDRGVTDEEAFCWLAQLRSVAARAKVTLRAEGVKEVRKHILISYTGPAQTSTSTNFSKRERKRIVMISFRKRFLIVLKLDINSNFQNISRLCSLLVQTLDTNPTCSAEQKPNTGQITFISLFHPSCSI